MLKSHSQMLRVDFWCLSTENLEQSYCQMNLSYWFKWDSFESQMFDFQLCFLSMLTSICFCDVLSLGLSPPLIVFNLNFPSAHLLSNGAFPLFYSHCVNSSCHSISTPFHHHTCAISHVMSQAVCPVVIPPLRPRLLILTTSPHGRICVYINRYCKLYSFKIRLIRFTLTPVFLILIPLFNWLFKGGIHLGVV